MPAVVEVGVRAVPEKMEFHWEETAELLPQYTAPVAEVCRVQLNIEDVVAKDNAVVVTPRVA